MQLLPPIDPALPATAGPAHRLCCRSPLTLSQPRRCHPALVTPLWSVPVSPRLSAALPSLRSRPTGIAAPRPLTALVVSPACLLRTLPLAGLTLGASLLSPLV